MGKGNIPTTLSTAYSIQGEILPDTEIICMIEKYFRIRAGEIGMKTRIPEIVIPRQIVIWIMANRNIKKNGEGKPEWSKIIVHYFPLFDHATMIYSFRAVENAIETNKIFRKMMNEIMKMIERRKITVGDARTN